MRTVALLAALLLVAPSLASAQGFVNAKYAGEFLGLGVGARSAGMGGAGTGFLTDVGAGYFNPAALAFGNYPQVSLLHESRFAGQINYDYLGGVLPLNARQTVGVTVLRLGLDGIKDSRDALIDRNGNGVLDEDDRIDSTRIRIGGAADWVLMGSYSQKVKENLALGGNVKLIYRTLLEHSAWGVGVDLSARYNPTPELTVGATLADATKSLLIWDTGNQEFIVPSFRLGGGYRLKIAEDHSVLPALDAVLRFEGRSSTTTADIGFASVDFAGGLEYSYKERVFVRGGYTELHQWSLGAGVKLPKLSIDYALTLANSGNNDLADVGGSIGPDAGGLGVTHRVSLTLTLESPEYARPEEGLAPGSVPGSEAPGR